MLAHLQQRVTEALAPSHSATLASCGPAHVQADELPCEVAEGCLYLLAPRTSDHLFNLEQVPEVVVTNRHWQLRGQARVVTGACPPTLRLLDHPDLPWCEVVEVCPARIQLRRPDGWGYGETIDVEGRTVVRSP